MSAPKWTPGPWFFGSDEVLGWLVTRDDGFVVADVDTAEDAHLIAAAPELCEALEACLHDLCAWVNSYAGGRTFAETDTAIAMGESALAKARGEV